MKKDISNLDFIQRLIEKADEYSGAELLQIEGVYEALSEHFQNEIIEEHEEGPAPLKGRSNKEEFKQDVIATINYLFNDDERITTDPTHHATGTTQIWHDHIKELRDTFLDTRGQGKAPRPPEASLTDEDIDNYIKFQKDNYNLEKEVKWLIKNHIDQEAINTIEDLLVNTIYE